MSPFIKLLCNNLTTVFWPKMAAQIISIWITTVRDCSLTITFTNKREIELFHKWLCRQNLENSGWSTQPFGVGRTWGGFRRGEDLRFPDEIITVSDWSRNHSCQMISDNSSNAAYRPHPHSEGEKRCLQIYTLLTDILFRVHLWSTIRSGIRRSSFRWTTWSSSAARASTICSAIVHHPRRARQLASMECSGSTSFLKCK